MWWGRLIHEYGHMLYLFGFSKNLDPSHPSKLGPSTAPDFVEIEWEVRGKDILEFGKVMPGVFLDFVKNRTLPTLPR